MRTHSLTSVILGGALALATAASVADSAPPDKKPQSAHQCFSRSMLSGFSAPDEHTLYLRANVNDVYRVETMGPCPDMDWSLRLGLEDRGGGGWICTGDLAEVIVADRGIGHFRCPVRIGPKLTKEEVAALPRKSRP
jgi:hypothetical protein